MPFLTRNNKRKFDVIKSPITLNKLSNTAIVNSGCEDKQKSSEISSSTISELDRLKQLEKKIKEKEDLVRRLKLVQHYKSRVLS